MLWWLRNEPAVSLNPFTLFFMVQRLLWETWKEGVKPPLPGSSCVMAAMADSLPWSGAEAGLCFLLDPPSALAMPGSSVCLVSMSAAATSHTVLSPSPGGSAHPACAHESWFLLALPSARFFPSFLL